MIIRTPETRRCDVRLPFLPLAREVAGSGALLHEHPERAAESASCHRDSHALVTDVHLAVILSVHQKQISRWWDTGLPILSAEDVCDRLGLHPVWIWDHYHQVVEDTAVLVYEDHELWIPNTEADERKALQKISTRESQRRIRRARRGELDDRAVAEGAAA